MGWMWRRADEASISGGRVFGWYELADGLFQLDPIQYHIPSASYANDANLAADPHDTKMLLAAWVGLFQFQSVSDSHANDLHGIPSLLYIFPIIITQTG